MTRRIVVAITGATGAVFGIRMLERLAEFDVERHLIISKWGAKTIEHETGYSVAEVRALADVAHGHSEQSAVVSSGSFATEGMVVAPCSMKTLASIASGLADDLVGRAADVVLKERRTLVLMVREAPLSAIHLENMLKLARLGVCIMPPVPAFYNAPESVEDVVDHLVTRTLDQFGLHSEATVRWDGRLVRAGGRVVVEGRMPA
ncbi:UbiX family flavin prenyltransferase [Agromyces sp. SYSU T00194]|uniref:UbiX family flavin prenyltransferase n=1 Tax=Agromyces chitinivorans TaxID=3158560 RepID=UPI003393E757